MYSSFSALLWGRVGARARVMGRVRVGASARVRSAVGRVRVRLRARVRVRNRVGGREDRRVTRHELENSRTACGVSKGWKP